MEAHVDYLCTFHYHGWEFDMPLRVDSPDMEQKELLFDMLTLALDEVCKEVSFSKFSSAEAKDLLNSETKKDVEFHFLNFYTPIWEPINFKKGIVLYKKNLIADDNGAMFQRVGKKKLHCAVKKEGKALRLSDINLEIDVVVPDKVLSVIASEIDLVKTEGHKFLFDHDEFNKKPGEAYLANFDPLPTSVLYTRQPDVYIDKDKNAYPYREYRKGDESGINTKTAEFLKSKDFTIHDKAVAREGREPHKYLLLERYENLIGQISQDY